MHQAAIVSIDQVPSIGVVKLVAVVKQSIETQTSQVIECSTLDLQKIKDFTIKDRPLNRAKV